MTGSLLGRPTAFERGDKLFLTTPLTLVTPTESQIEEYAFASAVKSNAPNEHIGWLDGRYVEAGKPNLNNAMWLNDELALRSLTPMLMPVTVMHDPRTAVGTIADCKLQAGAQGGGNSRIDTILAVWRHRFPDIWEEAEHNIKDGTLAQSMEALSPSYSCSDCGQQYVKLHEGKEQASWCEHLRNNSSSRILADVCFTGTGLIFGTRGGQPAYTEANLGHFQDEIAEYHAKAHLDSTYKPSGGPLMGFIQIDETELANLRREKDEAKRIGDERANEVRDLTTKVEKAEADLTKETTAKDEAEKKAKDLEDKAEQSTLKDKRLAALGTEFLAKLGEFTRGRLMESAGALSDDDWESALKEKEEMAGVKRDAGGSTPATPTPTPGTPTPDVAAAGSAFSDEELAAFVARGGVAEQAPAPTTGVPATRQLARAFANKRKPTPTPVAK
jgi:hypothetical protein